MPEQYRSYGPAGTDTSRPPKMTLKIMIGRLLFITDSNSVAYLPTGRIRTFDDMRMWAGFEPHLRDIFDQWAVHPDRKTIATEPMPRMGSSNAALQRDITSL